MLIRRLILAFALLVAALASQVPGFVADYRLELGRAVTAATPPAPALAAQQAAFAVAGPLSQYVVFAEDLDPTVARQTWQGFDPDLPASQPALIFAAMGLLMGLCLALALATPFRHGGPTRRRPAHVWR